ncbi:hypothetical protein AN403_4748 [Pseudomonas fluorescens]|uniref:Uncharacterized protein n=1 Tax=Pseudomonas fluorescens TaxID=294 RepID=A0A0P8XU01_PSEFL|nr:hypothetical protein AN403_4748 [Pseudomonas fluorescens]
MAATAETDMYTKKTSPDTKPSQFAMVVNGDAGCLNARGVIAFFASKLAPTGIFSVLSDCRGQTPNRQGVVACPASLTTVHR